MQPSDHQDANLLLGMQAMPAVRRLQIPLEQLETLISHVSPLHADTVRQLHAQLEAGLMDMAAFRNQVGAAHILLNYASFYHMCLFGWWLGLIFK